MKRITRDNVVPRDKRYQVREPVAKVTLGETFVVETINFRTPIIRTPADVDPPEYRERQETGPIFVKGIAAGDVLAIRFEDIRIEGHASGASSDETDRGSFMKVEGGKVHFPGGLRAPVHMMVGDIYVTPDDRPVKNPDDNGGNMDMRDVCAGNTLHLRARLDGGLLVLGDVHAAQGDGELSCAAAECAAKVTVRITKDQKFLPDRPMIETPDSLIFIAARRDYAEAVNLACDDAARILSRIIGCTERQAYLYATTVGHLRNGGIWMMKLGRTDPPPTIGLQVPLPD